MAITSFPASAHAVHALKVSALVMVWVAASTQHLSSHRVKASALARYSAVAASPRAQGVGMSGRDPATVLFPFSAGRRGAQWAVGRNRGAAHRTSIGPGPSDGLCGLDKCRGATASSRPDLAAAERARGGASGAGRSLATGDDCPTLGENPDCSPWPRTAGHWANPWQANRVPAGSTARPGAETVAAGLRRVQRSAAICNVALRNCALLPPLRCIRSVD